MSFERVIDGDTFMASGKRIRLWGIDAPEKTQSLYSLSAKFLASLISGGILRCKSLYQDRYQREVMHCSINDIDVGSAMVRWGMARDYRRFSKGFYEEDQAIAKTKKLGIWKPVSH